MIEYNFVMMSIKFSFFLLCIFLLSSFVYPKNNKVVKYNLPESLWEIKLSSTEIILIKERINKNPVVRGIHLTSWVAGDSRKRADIIEKIKNSVINTVVVAVKEKNGEVYIPGIEKAIKYKTYTPAISEPKKMLDDFKALNLYKIARIVCFHDNIIPKTIPEFSVQNINGGIWKSKNGDTWVDPYNKNVWEYIIDVAEKAAEYGFDEIQFDYVRYPTEGNTKLCRYSALHNKENAEKNLIDFLNYARKRLSKYNVKISVDVFGLTTNSSMGIGQNLKMIAENFDYVYPMMYPSHYYPGEYNLEDPESNPYKVINRGLKQAMNKVGSNYYKIIPYLQDFSLKVKYTPFDVRAQIIAVKNNYLNSWILWNPASRYSWETLTPQAFCAFIEPEKCYLESENLVK
ncbi:MAG: putative glycoside hydrolase [Elusimicrobiota bacterium]